MLRADGFASSVLLSQTAPLPATLPGPVSADEGPPVCVKSVASRASAGVSLQRNSLYRKGGARRPLAPSGTLVLAELQRLEEATPWMEAGVYDAVQSD